MRQYFSAGRPRVGITHRREFETGDQLQVSKGDFWLISKGCVQLEVSIGKVSRSIGIYGPGQVVGMDLGKEPLKLIATALTPTEACSIKTSIFIKYASNYESNHNAVTAFAAELSESHFYLWLLSARSAKARVAGVLLQLAKNIGVSKENKIAILVSRKTLAYNIGIAYETISRFLTVFEREGWIQRNGPIIFIINKEKLLQESLEN